MSPCATCTSACCRWPIAIGMTPADIERLGPARAVHVLPPEFPGGYYVGQLAKAADGTCIFLRENGCAIHEVKPEMCQQLEASTCRYYEPDAKKQLGLVRLRCDAA